MKSLKNIPGVAIDLRMQIRLSITVDPFGATPGPLGLVICNACRTGELYARAGIGTTQWDQLTPLKLKNKAFLYMFVSKIWGFI
jgi:hypothetical protein